MRRIRTQDRLRVNSGYWPSSLLTRTLFIINPTSARGATLRFWTAARQKFVDAGIDFDEYVTTRSGDATQVTRGELSNRTANIIAVGGDGTLSEVVNGYFDERGSIINNKSALGLLPSGTGSDFQRSLGTQSTSELIRALLDSESRLIDAGRAEFQAIQGRRVSRTFINVASFGLGGDVSALVNGWRDRFPRLISGRARFAGAAIVSLRRYKNAEVSMVVDGRDVNINSNLVVIANGRFAGGGMMLAPHAELDDGLLDVILTNGVTRFDILRELRRIQRGAHLRNPKVTEVLAREVSITASHPLAIDLDGEMVGTTPARITVLPSSIRFLSADYADDAEREMLRVKKSD
jgi:YegS/Rv2252/BmrU family lipid kinase